MTLSSAPPSPPTIGSLFSASPVPSGKPVRHEQWVRHPTLRLSDASRLIATTFAALRCSTIAAPVKDRRPAQRREFLALLAALPSRSLRVFSDGSSFDSTRAGAGYVATGPRNDLLFCHSVFLGAASNNAAELAALTYAANHCVDLLQLLPFQSRPPVFLFADNLYAINTGTGRWTAKSNLDAVASLKSSLLTLRALTTVAAHWVPGHSLIYGNEIADLLAKRGADGTTRSSIPDVPTLNHLRFQCNLPPLV